MNAPRPRYKRKKEKKTLALRNWNRLIKNNEMPLPPRVGTGEPTRLTLTTDRVRRLMR
jgi:hypothetical protein